MKEAHFTPKSGHARRKPNYVDTRAKPAELTVRQREKFEFVINLKADQRARLNYAAEAASPRRYALVRFG